MGTLAGVICHKTGSKDPKVSENFRTNISKSIELQETLRVRNVKHNPPIV